MVIYYLQLERRGAAAFLAGLAAVFLVVAFFAGADAFLNRACTFILSKISTAISGELKKLCDLWSLLTVKRD